MKHTSSMGDCIHISRCTYRISGNIGDIFNLVVWRSESKLPNFYHQIYIDLLTMLCPCCATAKFNFPQILRYSLILRKSPNLMIANISGYTVSIISAGELAKTQTMRKYPRHQEHTYIHSKRTVYSTGNTYVH